MEMLLSVAGKTFLAGEYLALYGGPALIAATEPRFQLKVSDQKNSFAAHQFHPECPAGKLWQKHQDFFSQFSVEMTDPYQTGGFGASTAQFVLLHALWQLKGQVFTETERFFDWHEMIKDYRELAFNGQGFPPSGADLVGMCCGGLTWFERETGNVQTFAWPFQEMDFILAKTTTKLATHEHLAALNQFETADLSSAMQKIRLALAQLNWDQFVSGLTEFRDKIERNGWLCAESKALVADLEKHPEIIFAKGCGAMGADVLLILFHKKNSSAVRQIVSDKKLLIRATASEVTRCLEVTYPAKEREIQV